MFALFGEALFFPRGERRPTGVRRRRILSALARFRPGAR